ncbi:MAG: hypothetical protein AB8H86_06625 [Polyangiales bacterium]
MSTPMPESLEALILAQVRSRYADFRKMGILYMAIMGLLAGLAYFAFSGNNQKLWFIGTCFGPLGLIPVFLSFRDPAKAKSLQLLPSRWNDIVWLHVRVVTGSANVAMVRCGMSDGQFFVVPCEAGQEGAVLHALAAYVPHATTGFTPQLDARFRDSPDSLRVQ